MKKNIPKLILWKFQKILREYCEQFCMISEYLDRVSKTFSIAGN